MPTAELPAGRIPQPCTATPRGQTRPPAAKQAVNDKEAGLEQSAPGPPSAFTIISLTNQSRRCQEKRISKQTAWGFAAEVPQGNTPGAKKAQQRRLRQAVLCASPHVVPHHEDFKGFFQLRSCCTARMAMCLGLEHGNGKQLVSSTQLISGAISPSRNHEVEQDAGSRVLGKEPAGGGMQVPSPSAAMAPPCTHTHSAPLYCGVQVTLLELRMLHSCIQTPNRSNVLAWLLLSGKADWLKGAQRAAGSTCRAPSPALPLPPPHCATCATWCEPQRCG